MIQVPDKILLVDDRRSRLRPFLGGFFLGVIAGAFGLFVFFSRLFGGL